MNILGVGAAELVAILLIMLVFAGPKRMIHWSYVLGQHVAKFRKIWSETVDLVQKEFDEAGVDIKLPKEPPTRKSLNRTVSDAVKPMTQPVQDSLDEVKKDLDSVQEVSDALNNKKPKTKPSPKKAPVNTAKSVKLPKPAGAKAKAQKPQPATGPKLGAWSGAPIPGKNGSAVDLGAWTKAARGEGG